MAQKRYISTNFWKDNYIADLNPIEKLLYIYLLTNRQTNIGGVYEIGIKEIAFDTGIDKDMVIKMLSKFENDSKIVYRKGWLGMRNWIKHQSKSEKIQKGISKILDEAPDWFLDEITKSKNGQKTMDLDD